MNKKRNFFDHVSTSSLKGKCENSQNLPFFRRQSLRVRLKIIFFVEALFGISSIGVAVFCPQIQQGPLIEQLHKTLFKRILLCNFFTLYNTKNYVITGIFLYGTKRNMPKWVTCTFAMQDGVTMIRPPPHKVYVIHL